MTTVQLIILGGIISQFCTTIVLARVYNKTLTGDVAGMLDTVLKWLCTSLLLTLVAFALTFFLS